MENKLTRDQVRTILQNAPKGTEPSKIIDGLVARGYILEGFNEPKSVVDNAKDLAIGFGKGVARTAVNATSGVQDIGQGILGGAEALVTGKPLEQTKAFQPGVGFESLKQETPEGQELSKNLAPTNDMQKYGGMAETGAEVLAGGGAQLLKAGAVRGAELIAGSKLIPAVKTGTTAVKTALTPDSAAIMQRVARIPKGKQIKFEDTAGESVGDYLVKRGIYGDEEQIVEQLYKRFNDSKNVADEALASLEGTYQPQQVKDALEMLAEKFTKASTKGAKDPNLARTEELIAKLDGEGLSMTEINEAKRLFEKNVKLDFARENSPDGLRLSNNVDEAIRQWQFGQAEQLGLKNLPEINRETRLARQLMDDLGAESAGIAGNNAVSLTDWIVLAEGNPASIAAFLGKKAAANKKIQSAVAKKFAPEVSVGQPEAIFKTPKSTTLPQPQKVSQQSLVNDTTKATASKVDNFERASGLTPQNKTIEDKAFKKILNNEPELLKAYKAKYGNEVNADNFRPFFKDVGYNGANAAAVQEPSSYLAKKAYLDALKNKGNYATFSAGGSGAGKSSGIKAISELTDLKNQSAVLLDSNLSSYSSAIKKIKQAEDAGKEFKGIYTYRDPIDSFVNGVVKRMNDNPEEMGRIVPTKVMAGNHIDSLRVVQKLIKDGYSFRIVDNSLGAGKAKLTTLEDIVQKAKYPSVQELTGILNREAKKLLDKGVITKNQYEEYIK